MNLKFFADHCVPNTVIQERPVAQYLIVPVARYAERIGFTRGCQVLHPNQFQVNAAWIAFKLNDKPIHTEQDGDFDFIALMDAASCFILSSTPVPTKLAEPTQMESRRLLKQGQAHKKQWPKTLFVPAELPVQFLAAEAERLGIRVIRVAEDQLLLFIGEAKEAFRERFGSGDAQ